jgi:hypothetical protein
LERKHFEQADQKKLGMNAFDIGVFLIALRSTIPTAKLKTFEDLLYRGALSPNASDDLRWALNIEPRESAKRPFEVVTGGAA